MNVYEKIQLVKQELLQKNLKKSGNNKFANYDYYELGDFLPAIISVCNEHKLFTAVSFDEINAMLTIINCEKPEEQILYTSPMRSLDLKGCNQIQSLGGVETYSRRYLYMAAFDIVENDMFDGVNGKSDNKASEPKYIDEEMANSITKGLSFVAGDGVESQRKLLTEVCGIPNVYDIPFSRGKEILEKLRERARA